MKRFCLLIICILSIHLLFAENKREVRAAWIVSNSGNDWAKEIGDTESQRREIDNILDRLHAANFNTVLFQVQDNGSVLWDSSLQPPMFCVMTSDGKVSWDVCRYVIDGCHSRGMECHAWVSVCKLGDDSDIALYSDGTTLHPAETHQELIVKHGKTYYFNPGLPEVGDYLIDLYTELLDNYNFDGINLGYIQYPGTDFNDQSTYREYNPEKMPKDEWRIENINSLVERIYDEVKERNPMTKVGASTEGTYRNSPGYGNLTAYSSYFQDPCRWMQEGYIDMIVPQMFYNEGYGFTDNMGQWVNNSGDRHLIIGISPRNMSAPTDSWSPETIIRQIEKIRDREGTYGICFFSASDITCSEDKSIELYNRLVNDCFRYPAHIPSMNYDGETRPGAPENVTVDFYSGKYTITWDAPTETQVPVKYYTVYLANGTSDYTDDPRNEVAHYVTDTSFTFESDEPGIEFAVTAFDLNYNESIPAKAAGIDNPEIDRSIDFRYAFGNITVYSGIPLKSVDIHTMQGNHTRHVSTSGCDVTISCEGMSPGMYIATVTQCDGASNVYKFVR